MRWEILREMGQPREALAVAKEQRRQLKALFLDAGGGEDELESHARELKQMREDAQVEACNALMYVLNVTCVTYVVCVVCVVVQRINVCPSCMCV